MSVKDKALAEYANKIWLLCKGLGWTLDSERATNAIAQEVARAVESCERVIDSQQKDIALLRAEISKLKKHIVAMNRTKTEETEGSKT